MGFLLTKTFLKNDKSIKIAAECDWVSKISQNFRKLGFSWKKTGGFSEKKLYFFKNCWK